MSSSSTENRPHSRKAPDNWTKSNLASTLQTFWKTTGLQVIHAQNWKHKLVDYHNLP
jgi:hypothetical protein